jgi:hypothetical protein
MVVLFSQVFWFHWLKTGCILSGAYMFCDFAFSSHLVCIFSSVFFLLTLRYDLPAHFRCLRRE